MASEERGMHLGERRREEAEKRSRRRQGETRKADAVFVCTKRTSSSRPPSHADWMKSFHSRDVSENGFDRSAMSV